MKVPVELAAFLGVIGLLIGFGFGGCLAYETGSHDGRFAERCNLAGGIVLDGRCAAVIQIEGEK